MSYLEDFYLSDHNRDYHEYKKYNYAECPSSDVIECIDYNKLSDVILDCESQYGEMRNKLYECIKLLSQHQQNVINLFLQGLTQRQIAYKLNISRTAVNFAINGSNGYGGIIKRLRILMKGRECKRCGHMIEMPSSTQLLHKECRKE